MKILVQNCVTHVYLKTPGEWTSDVEEARDFPTSEQAILYCSEHQIPTVQVVLKFDSDRYDINVPITPECEDTERAQSTLRN